MTTTHGAKQAELLADDPVVHEWDDGSCLEHSVERLAAERSELSRLTRARRRIAVAAQASLLASVVAVFTACSASTGGLVIALYVGNAFLMMRACMLDLLDQERAQRAEEMDRWTRDVHERLDRTDWLLVP